MLPKNRLSLMDGPPLARLKVLELATILAGPSVGMFLAELGARVVKVEPPDSGDPTRGWYHPEESGEHLSAYFNCVNWGKRSIVLDLRQHRSWLDPLLAQSDILLMNCKPGDEVKLQLQPEELMKQHPRLIIGWVCGYPDSSRPGLDALIQAEAGFMSMNGPPGGPPCKLPVALVDLLAAHQLKAGILLALWLRDRGQGGRLVKVSLWEAALASLANQATHVLMTGVEPTPQGSEHPNLFPYGTRLLCRDGELLLAVGTDRQFERLCQCLGYPELAQRYPKQIDRVSHREAVRTELMSRSQHLASQELLDHLHRLGVPAGRIQSVGQALEGAPAWQAGPLRGLPGIAFSGFARRSSLPPPPRLGEHEADPWGPPNWGEVQSEE